MSEVEARVREIISKTFNLSAAEASGDLGLERTQAWDSLGHMQLIAAVEQEFGVQLPAYAIADLVDVPAILKALEEQRE